jgi:hypothetical protein
VTHSPPSPNKGKFLVKEDYEANLSSRNKYVALENMEKHPPLGKLYPNINVYMPNILGENRMLGFTDGYQGF